MTGRAEGDPTNYYGKLFNQLGNDAKLSASLAESFLGIRRQCLGELSKMQQLVEELKPTPNFLTFSGAVDTQAQAARYYCHSLASHSFTKALMQMRQAYNQGRFTTDAHNQIVAADSNAIIPQVVQFTPVIESSKAYKLPKNHLAVVIYSLADRIVKKVTKSGQGGFEYIVFMLAEGVNEPIDDISVILSE